MLILITVIFGVGLVIYLAIKLEKIANKMYEKMEEYEKCEKSLLAIQKMQETKYDKIFEFCEEIFMKKMKSKIHFNDSKDNFLLRLEEFNDEKLKKLVVDKLFKKK